MNLIDTYVYEVTKRLPEKSRDDIAMEIRSTIEDMLPDDYSEEDVKKTLSKLGDPTFLANEYRDSPAYLIGPLYYDLYITMIKTIMPLAIGIGLTIYFMVSFAEWERESGIGKFIAILFGESIWAAITIFIQVIFWITLVFFILERSGVSPSSIRKTGENWKPEDLKDITFIPKKKAISKAEVITSMIWTSIWAFIYFNADHFIGVYEKNSLGNLELIVPVFNQEVLLSYWLVIILFIGTEFALAIYKWISRQWTYTLAFIHSVYNLLFIMLSIAMLTNSDLISAKFIDYMIKLLNGTHGAADTFIDWIIGSTIATIIITVAISVFDGFRKARIKSNLGLGFSKK